MAVMPSEFSAVAEDPASIRTRTTSLWPPLTAKCNGSESLTLFRTVVTKDLLKRINSFITATEPLFAAIWAQVMPLLLAAVTNSGLYLINNFTTSEWSFSAAK